MQFSISRRKMSARLSRESRFLVILEYLFDLIYANGSVGYFLLIQHERETKEQHSRNEKREKKGRERERERVLLSARAHPPVKCG